MLKVLNYKQIDDYTVELDDNFKGGFYAYIHYEKGSEDFVIMRMKMLDIKHPLKRWFYVAEEDVSLKPFEFYIDQDTKDIVVPIPLPESADKVRVEFEYINSPDPSTEGLLELFFNNDYKQA